MENARDNPHKNRYIMIMGINLISAVCRKAHVHKNRNGGYLLVPAYIGDINRGYIRRDRLNKNINGGYPCIQRSILTVYPCTMYI